MLAPGTLITKQDAGRSGTMRVTVTKPKKQFVAISAHDHATFSICGLSLEVGTEEIGTFRGQKWWSA